jgi:hypothetical protein
MGDTEHSLPLLDDCLRWSKVYLLADFLDGILTAQYNENDLNLRYCYKVICR